MSLCLETPPNSDEEQQKKGGLPSIEPDKDDVSGADFQWPVPDIIIKWAKKIRRVVLKSSNYIAVKKAEYATLIVVVIILVLDLIVTFAPAALVSFWYGDSYIKVVPYLKKIALTQVYIVPLYEWVTESLGFLWTIFLVCFTMFLFPFIVMIRVLLNFHALRFMVTISAVLFFAAAGYYRWVVKRLRLSKVMHLSCSALASAAAVCTFTLGAARLLPRRALSWILADMSPVTVCMLLLPVIMVIWVLFASGATFQYATAAESVKMQGAFVGTASLFSLLGLFTAAEVDSPVFCPNVEKNVPLSLCCKKIQEVTTKS